MANVLEFKTKNKQLEQRNKLLEETIKARNPNSIPMLIAAASDVKKAEDDEPSKK